jgi:hypothetical protein
MALQALAGIYTPGTNLNADVDGVGKIGIGEAL